MHENTKKSLTPIERLEEQVRQAHGLSKTLRIFLIFFAIGFVLLAAESLLGVFGVDTSGIEPARQAERTMQVERLKSNDLVLARLLLDEAGATEHSKEQNQALREAHAEATQATKEWLELESRSELAESSPANHYLIFIVCLAALILTQLTQRLTGIVEALAEEAKQIV